MTKADRIRELAKRNWTRHEIAQAVGCGVNYVDTIIWRARNPDYHRAWMERRRQDPAYARRELDAQIAAERARKEQRREG